MTTVYDTDDDGNIIVVFDSRWRYPELLGYSPDDPQYEALQRMWEKATGRSIEEDEGNDKAGKQQRQDKQHSAPRTDQTCGRDTRQEDSAGQG